MSETLTVVLSSRFVLVCIECDRESPDGRGWRAEIADDPFDDAAPEVAVYCPTCWEREFGGS